MAKDAIDALLEAAPAAAPQQGAAPAASQSADYVDPSGRPHINIPEKTVTPSPGPGVPDGQQGGAQDVPVAHGSLEGGGSLKLTPEGYPFYDATAPSGPGTAQPNDGPVTGAMGSDIPEAAAGGIAQAGFEIKDFLTGGAPAQKSGIRTAIEQRTQALAGQGLENGLATGIAQFGTAFLGVGEVLMPLAYASKALKAGQVAAGVQGGVAAAVGLDPHGARLSDFIQQFPALQNPVTNFLAAKPEDSDALGRFKNSLENLLLPAGIGAGAKAITATAKASVKVLTSVVEALKFQRAGNIPAANAAVQAAKEALAKATPKGGPNAAPNGSSPSGLTSGPGPGGSTPRAGGPAGVGEPTLHTADTGAGSPAGGPGQPGAVTDQAQVPGSATGLERQAQGSPLPAPAPKPKVDLTPDQVHGLIAKAQKDTGAILDAGSYDAAAAEGHAFAQTDLIPWQKFASGNERVDAWLERVVEENAYYVTKARGGNAKGVMTDKAVDTLVERLGTIAGQDPALIRGMLLRAGDDAKNLAAKMETAFVISQKAFQDAYGLVMRINAQNIAEYETQEMAIAAAKGRMVTAVEMFGAAKSIMAAGGRIVRRSQAQFNTQDLAIKADFANMAGQDFLDFIASSKGNPQALSDKMMPTMAKRILDFATLQQSAGLLWGWSTLVAIAVADASALYLRPMATFMGSHWQVGKAIQRGDDALLASASIVRHQARKEMLITHTFLNDGWQAAVEAFKRGDSRLAPHSSELQGAGTTGDAATSAMPTRPGTGDLSQAALNWRPVNSLDDIVYNAMQSALYLGSNPAVIISQPFRIHGALEEIVKNMRYRAVVTAKADTEALANGLDPKSQAYKDYITTRVRDSFDANGAGLDTAALKEGRASVFQDKLIKGGTPNTWGGLPTAGAVAQQTASSWPVMRIMAPYIAIPSNLFRYNVRLTPGLNMLQKEYLENLKGTNGPTAQAMATGEMMLGLLFGMKAMQMRMDGRLTGPGPTDHKMASSWRADGHMANSVVTTDKDGNKSYFQLHRFEPYQAPFTFWGDVVDMMQQGHPDAERDRGILVAALLSTMHLMKDKTMLKSLADTMDVLTGDDDNKMKAWFQKMSPGLVIPASSAMKQVAQHYDPYIRELNGWFDGIKADLPGFSKTLPARHDAYGDPVTIPGKFTSEQKYSPLGAAVDENFAATGHYPTPPSHQQGGVDLRDITLENGQTAYERFQELAGHPKGQPSLKDALNKMVQSKAYQGLTHGKITEEGTQENAMEKLFTAYHSAGLGALRMESKVVQEAMTARAKQIFGANKTKQKDLRASAAEGATSAINKLLGPMGISIPTTSALSQVPPTDGAPK